MLAKYGNPDGLRFVDAHDGVVACRTDEAGLLTVVCAPMRVVHDTGRE